ncbi:MAG: transglycosylase domain-containing protein, partial [Woeseiaceae bacterium]
QGGSTLTQQLVRSYFLDNRQTLGRKIREAIMALFLEARFDKPDILTAYVNEVYLGQHGSRAIHGFGLASLFYFGKPLAELELHEIALLVAIVRGPSYYDPRRYPERARDRRNLVLGLLGEFEVVPPHESQRAIEHELGVTERGPLTAGYYPAFMDLLRRQLEADYREEDLTSRGLTIFTTLNPLIQASAEARLADGLAALQEERAEGPVTPPLEGAIVVTSVQSAEVLAVVGGRRTAYDGFNRALDARRQVGSLIKPAVYLAALESGEYGLASRIDDAETVIELENGDLWKPDNLGGESHGSVPLIRALAESYNLATVRLGMAVGVANVAETLHQLGAVATPRAYPSLLLGALDLSPLEVAQIYNTLANGGFRTPLRSVNVVVDAQGEALRRYPMEIARAADPAAVHQLTQALITAMDRGTGRSSRAILPRDFVTAGKTGTSDGFRDSWFAGYTGEHVAVVWVGNDDNLPTGLTGARGALPIWSRLIAGLGSAPLLLPGRPDLRSVWLDYDTGLLVNRRCAAAVHLALPADAELGRQAGCGSDASRIAQAAREFLQDLLD